MDPNEIVRGRARHLKHRLGKEPVGLLVLLPLQLVELKVLDVMEKGPEDAV